MQGTVKKISDKGFGFIDDGTGKDMFFHVTGMRERTEFNDIQDGDKVEFTIDDSGDRPRAIDVVISSKE